MNNQIAAFGVALALASGPSVFANNHGSGGSAASAAPAAHNSAPTNTAHSNGTPHLSGMSHLSGVNPYRPVITNRNGVRTLTYPGVGNSILRQPASNTSGLLRQNSHSNANGNHPLDPQTSARLRNWNGNVSNTQQAHSNHLNNVQHHHDHDWWRHHCIAFVFFDFGWWGWWDGWWYPAWGYDPYSYYEYNEPIYGYNGQSPEQIIANVQTALQQLGYYQYAVDGKMGPLTRSALARYQRDHRLPITSGLDPATLGSLGIIR